MILFEKRCRWACALVLVVGCGGGTSKPADGNSGGSGGGNDPGIDGASRDGNTATDGTPSDDGSRDIGSSLSDASVSDFGIDINEGAVDASSGHVLVTQIAGGDGFTCALTVAGGIKCWGDPLNGNSVTAPNVARDVVGLTNGVKKIAAAGSNVCALRADDQVVCWGSNGYGQLAIDPTLRISAEPVEISGFASTATDVAVMFTYSGATSHGCVVDSASNIRCWGNNSSSQLGTTSPSASGSVLSAPNLTGFQAVVGGEAYTCGLTDAGGVKCWGSDQYAQLGDGNGSRLTPNTAVPQQVAGMTSGVQQIVGNARTACALTEAGGVKCWGSGAFSQLGPGVTLDPDTGGVTIPTDVQGLTSGVTRLAGGYQHFCALLQDRTIQCWGYDQNGQLGDQPAHIDINQNGGPTKVLGLANVAAVGVGRSHTCAAVATGGVMCWGSGWASGSDLSVNQIEPEYVAGI